MPGFVPSPSVPCAVSQNELNQNQTRMIRFFFDVVSHYEMTTFFSFIYFFSLYSTKHNHFDWFIIIVSRQKKLVENLALTVR